MSKKKMGVEKRSAVLYARVKPSAKAWLQKVAKTLGISESKALDKVLDDARKTQL